ncbi:amidohydrolase [Haloplanus pelagicus]|jgi:5-methylthioadenosine/S-adenosylhomocysteine deaminase|uniref:amidohydrolase n=1 Tax=Haloplanus pelagicus TaxID=2949995 RepID=UPI00204185E9|nr:amidohydrolase [Haloplanus sp. HW8-1]
MQTLAIRDGRILHPDMTVAEADVLVDRAAGEIVEIGAGLDGDEELDASDGLVIPGLVNAHTHVAMTLLRGHADDKPLDTWLREDIWPVEAALEPADIEAGAALGVLEMIRSGTTTFADMYFEIDRTADVVERAGLRAVLGHGAIAAGKAAAEARDDVEESIAMARELDGAADGRISTAVMPHSLTTVTPELLELAAEGAADAGVPVHYHANETVDEVDPIVAERGQRPLEWAQDLGLCDDSAFLAHGVHLDDAEMALLAETGTGVVHCPASNMKLASGMAPVQRLLDAGVSVGLGTDGAASNNDLDLFDELRDAAMLGKLAADDASAVAAPDAVRMATAGGASVLGLDAGRIEPGAAADLAVLDLDLPHLTPRHDLVSHLAYAAKGSDVRHTVCDGTVLMRDREVLTLDEAAVMERAEKRARGLLKRAGVRDETA